MNRLLSILFIFLTCTVFSQQSENRKTAPFKGVRVSEGIDVYLKKGDKETIRVEVSGIDLDRVITEVSGDYLKVRMAEGKYRSSRTVKVYVTYVELNKLSASSAGNLYVDGILRTRTLSVSASSAGSIEAEVDVQSLEASASSAADIVLKGKAKSVDIDASSAGEVDAYALEAEEGYIQASSAATVKITVSEKIDARASSGAGIRYRGSPMKTNTNSSSGGSVKKSN